MQINRHWTCRSTWWLQAFLALAAWAIPAGPACAQVVTTTSDSGAGSLRQAILDANSSGGGEITFSNVTGTITLLSPLPPVLENLTVRGPGRDLLTISGNNQHHVFTFVTGTTNTLRSLTIANGNLTNDLGGLALNLAGACISNAGSLKLLNCVVADGKNHALGPGPVNAGGGGIYNAGEMVMQNCLVTNCEANYRRQHTGGGGGIVNAGKLKMNYCTVADCRGYFGGGIVSGNELWLNNCLITDCVAGHQGDGGAIACSGNVTIESSEISYCEGFWAGGIDSSANLTITNSTIRANVAWDGPGGGLLLFGATNVLVGCTVDGNEAFDNGGGIAISFGQLSLLNCTISGNGGGGIGYGPWSEPELINLNHCTVTSNYPSFFPSEGISGTVHSQNSIFAGNAGVDISGQLISGGYNLIQNTNECVISGDEAGNLYGFDPLLGPLANHGGSTWTHALLAGSPAIDQGNSGGLVFDARGLSRTYDVPEIPNSADGSDIGAYEQSQPPTATNLLVSTIQNQALGIPISKMLLCGFGPNGSTINLLTTDSTSANGGTIIVSDECVVYQPPLDYLGGDNFTFTIADAWGGITTANLLVEVSSGTAQSVNLLSLLPTTNGLAVKFAGVVGFNYSIQRAPAPSGPWVTVGVATVGMNGVGSFEDSTPHPDTAFYRTTYP